MRGSTDWKLSLSLSLSGGGVVLYGGLLVQVGRVVLSCVCSRSIPLLFLVRLFVSLRTPYETRTDSGTIPSLGSGSVRHVAVCVCVGLCIFLTK